jgi:hypothetical protein
MADKDTRKKAEEKGFVQRMFVKFGNKNRKKAAESPDRTDRQKKLDEMRNTKKGK